MTTTGLEVWPDVLAHLQRHHPTICRRWFAEELKPAALQGGTLSVRAQSPYHREYLSKYCADQFSDALRSVTGRLLTVQFLGPDEHLPPRPDGAVAVDLHPTDRAEARGRAVAPPASRTDSRHDDAASHASARAGSTATEPRGRSTGSIDQRSATHAEPRPQRRGDEADAATLSPNRDRHREPSRQAEEAFIQRGPDDSRYSADPTDGSLVINPDYDFESFVVGPSNRLAHAAAKAVCENPGRAYNPLFIHGDVGLGKTHLLQAICLEMLRHDPDTVVCYLSCEGFMTQFMQAVRAGRMIDFRHRFRDVDILVVDDIHYLGSRDRTQEEFFHTFNTLFHATKQIVLSSDAPPERIPDLQDRLVSRFKWGLVASVEAPSFETRIEILKTKAEIRGMDLPDDVAFYIAQHATAHVRELEGHVVKLKMHTSIDNRPVDIEMAREALDLVEPVTTGTVTIHTIIEGVVERYDVRLKDLQSKDRTRSIALPRQICMYLAKKNTHLSLKEIGGFFGGRDHTTVLHAVRTVEARRLEDEAFNASLAHLEARLLPQG